MGIWLVSFQVRDDLIGFTKVDLFKTLLKDYFRGKLRDDQYRLNRALILLVPVLPLGAKSTCLNAGLSFASPDCMIQLVFCCVLSSWS